LKLATMLREAAAGLALAAALLHAPLAGAAELPVERFDETGFAPLFDGATLSGWHVNAASGHSAASGHRSGGAWTVEAGAIVGRQDAPGNGGLLVSDESFRDVEVVLEFAGDFPFDSGLFLRTSERGAAYQAMIDLYPGGTVGGVYGEGLSGGINVRNYVFLDAPERIRTVPAAHELPIPAEAWPALWRPGWNELRARIEGDPPRVTTWLNGVRIMEFADTELRHQAEGPVALQVHGGGDTRARAIRFRAIRARRLE
jgi:Domain of Unknown Function (DUF1080)